MPNLGLGSGAGSDPCPSPCVNIVGLGNMGAGMAQRLLACGWRVFGCDVDPSRLQIFKENKQFAGASIAKFATDSVATIVCVVDAAQTEDVLFSKAGLAHQLPAGHTVLLCPTIAPEDVERFAAQLLQRGICTIDAPMSGGPARAANGSMSLMVACTDAVFDANAPLLQTLSSSIHRISQRVGDGARTKLVNNLLAGINWVGAAEAMVLAQRLGLDLPTTLAVVEQSSGQSWIGSDRMQRVLAGDASVKAQMGLLRKDTLLALAAAQKVGFAGPLGQHAHQVFQDASAAGWQDSDDAAVFAHLQAISR